MKYIIKNTTDGKFIGDIISYNNEKKIILPDKKIMNIDKKIKLNLTVVRLYNSNYCVDIKEV